MPRASSSSGDSSGNPWFHDLRFMDFFGSPRGEFTGNVRMKEAHCDILINLRKDNTLKMALKSSSVENIGALRASHAFNSSVHYLIRTHERSALIC